MQHTNIVVNYRESVQKMETFGDFCHRTKSKLKRAKNTVCEPKSTGFFGKKKNLMAGEAPSPNGKSLNFLDPSPITPHKRLQHVGIIPA